MSADLQRLADEAALRRTAELYAQGVDRCDKSLWAAVLAEDCTIAAPAFSITGREANLGSIDAIGPMFRGTRHVIHQQVVQIDGDTARGETYCTADHLLNEADSVLVWHIRYQDQWRRESDGAWRFTLRQLIVDWQETRPVHDVTVTR